MVSGYDRCLERRVSDLFGWNRKHSERDSCRAMNIGRAGRG